MLVTVAPGFVKCDGERLSLGRVVHAGFVPTNVSGFGSAATGAVQVRQNRQGYHLVTWKKLDAVVPRQRKRQRALGNAYLTLWG
jgi:hypothetical protein